jgi:hypothetical protein
MHAGFKIERQARPVTPRFAGTNGSEASAKSRRSSAPSAQISASSLSPMMWSDATLPVTMNVAASSLLVSIRCFQDETCFFLAADFDKAGWKECSGFPRNGWPERCDGRSRTLSFREDAHTWLFFEEAIPAGLAGNLGSHLLTESMERRPDIGLDSYDRFFPNQDTLPEGGFGNLIVLPLQKGPREQGSTVFLDDQSAFLSRVRRDRHDTALAARPFAHKCYGEAIR